MINQVILVGNLGQDPEIASTPSGQRYARLSVATSDSWRDKATGEKRERTEWHRVVVWNEGIVGILEQYAKKGGKLFVQGKIATREWEKDGAKRYTTEVVVQGGGDTIRMLGSDGKGGGVPPPDAPPAGRYGASDYARA